ncbi:MAG: class I tRNA ligase family protein, partial [archaeon]
RSHKPVVFRPTEQWFLKIENLVPTLLKYNKKVSWTPERCGESYDKWAENLRDNGITRQRYWGCPAPIWVNVKNREDYFVIGSVEELEKLTKKKFDDLSLHRPWIDEVSIKKDGKEYRRIEDVIDVWIDSGTAGWNCLYNDPKLIKEWFPADLVLEATEQTKLWFSMLQICSAIYMKKSAYKNVFCHGMILDFQGMKMSKSIGNIISPYEVIDKYCADILRYYICQTTAGENISFSWEDIKTKQGNLMILANIANYIKDLERMKLKKGKPGIEEKWMLSRYHSSLNNISKLFEQYKLDETIGEMENLYLSLSRDYIKLVRDKANEDSAVLDVLKEVYLGILKVFSTICPFISEKMWQDFREVGMVKEESVHLCAWPEYEKKKIDAELEKEFTSALRAIELGLAERDKAKIGLRWPLGKATIVGIKFDKKLEEMVARQLNVKSIFLKKTGENETGVELDTTMTPELEAEGFAREISRKIQAERKNAGLKKGELIPMKIAVSSKLGEYLKDWNEFLRERVNASKLEILDAEAFDKLGKTGKKSFFFTVKEEKISSIFL